MILLDSGGLFAVLVSEEPAHEATRLALDLETAPFVLSPFALCELDYLLASRVGVDYELELLGDVARGSYELPSFGEEDIAAAHGIVAQYRDLGIGLADASIVVLAGRYGTNRVLTLDKRHFRAMRTQQGEPFTILPADD